MVRLQRRGHWTVESIRYGRRSIEETNLKNMAKSSWRVAGRWEMFTCCRDLLEVRVSFLLDGGYLSEPTTSEGGWMTYE